MHTAEGIKTNNLNKKKIWDDIKETQPLYDVKSLIYKSFEIRRNENQRIWVHGNATEHLRELELNIMKNTPKTPEAKRLATELILTYFHESLKEATKNGIKYDEIIKIGRWEFKFSPPRNKNLLPALIHAQPK
ncbi:hemagglutinin [Capnocytophaga felis]|uniref:hemagglutinin n=1 Tax=Capnocytophaga felis TaxID=2267611 RepID=UPI0015674766|nr:hemagglutinin [Capnocytophaga felis]